MDLRAASQAFCGGFCYTKSFTHPYIVSECGPLFVMHDAPRISGDYRCAEVVAPNVPADEVLNELPTLVSQAHLSRYVLSTLLPTQGLCEETKSTYKASGFRYRGIEPMMANDLRNVSRFTCPATILRVSDWETAERVNGSARRRQIHPEHLVAGRPALRLYAAEIKGKPVGWVRSIETLPNVFWVSNLYVKPEYRRNGIAKALMSKMLADDKDLGGEYSLLLASVAGAQVYPGLGYEQIGTLHLFRPIN